MRSTTNDHTPDGRIIKTYVWHGDKCWFVSTIERDSSAMLGPKRYNETIVWEYDWKNRKPGKMIHQASEPVGSIATHQRICSQLHKNGENPIDIHF